MRRRPRRTCPCPSWTWFVRHGTSPWTQAVFFNSLFIIIVFLLERLYHTTTICRQTSSVSLCSSSRMRSASSSSPCMTAYSRDAPQKLCFGGEIRQRRTRRARKRPHASSRVIASIVLVRRSLGVGGSSLCGIAIVSTPPIPLNQWGGSSTIRDNCAIGNCTILLLHHVMKS